ncbi:MAG: hypothetical protein Ct9H90mP9_0580 [Pseudomonadota bacterium]|nr:MAG: hypothetical protein Ct9H90mP9_0580 [Pseudomonadota bacterium]
MEHITTKDAVDYVIQGGPNIAATVTTHHLIINRNAYLAGGIRPHYYCLPVAKRETHRMALRSAVCSGNEKFFLGTDSAPHLDGAKENACGCAGIYTSVNTLSCLRMSLRMRMHWKVRRLCVGSRTIFLQVTRQQWPAEIQKTQRASFLS